MALKRKFSVYTIDKFFGQVYNIRTGVRKNYLSGGIDMNDIMSSPAFQEFLQKRCEEIVSNDRQIRDIDFLITEAENKLKRTFSKTQLELFLQYEKLCSDYQIVTEKTIYEQCLRDSAYKK